MIDEWRQLEAGEIIQEGDERDACVNPMKDDAVWERVPPDDIGKPAPTHYPAHTVYRRRAER
jgi:hypothetical protein